MLSDVASGTSPSFMYNEVYETNQAECSQDNGKYGGCLCIEQTAPPPTPPTPPTPSAPPDGTSTVTQDISVTTVTLAEYTGDVKQVIPV